MAWVGSDRAARLPKGWAKIRKRIIRRDQGRCTARDSLGNRCTWPGTEVDHIEPGDDHSDANLRLLCTWHHARKSATEGGTAAAKTRVLTARLKTAHPALEE
jgi:5-methylcytosine-specific restriction enzyme A